MFLTQVLRALKRDGLAPADAAAAAAERDAFSPSFWGDDAKLPQPDDACVGDPTQTQRDAFLDRKTRLVDARRRARDAIGTAYARFVVASGALALLAGLQFACGRAFCKAFFLLLLLAAAALQAALISLKQELDSPLASTNGQYAHAALLGVALLLNLANRPRKKNTFAKAPGGCLGKKDADHIL